MQLDAAELQVAYASGDLNRLRDVLDESPLRARNGNQRVDKVVDDRTSAAGIIHGNFVDYITKGHWGPFTVIYWAHC